LNLQPLFKEPILNQQLLQGLASDLWLVKTDKSEAVVRSTTVTDLNDASFLKGCYLLYGLDFRKIFDLNEINHCLASMTHFTIPKVVGMGTIAGKEYVVVEKFAGEAFDLNEQSQQFIESFGRGIAQLHKEQFDTYGDFRGEFRFPLREFHARMIKVMEKVIDEFYSHRIELQTTWKALQTDMSSIRQPSSASFTLTDMSIRQFLKNDDVIALIDTEACVVAPRELDLIALELSFKQQTADAFKKGYAQVLPFPELAQIRKLYRFLHFLFQINGPADFYEWMNRP
jgi:fructosamine-3-kinase